MYYKTRFYELFIKDKLIDAERYVAWDEGYKQVN